MNYFPFHVGDYAAHTSHLEPMEDLAYRRMLDAYYLREGPLPSDPREIARLIRLRNNMDEIESVLVEFFVLTDSGWSHARCDAEIAKMQDKQAKARASAEASVNARKASAQRTLNERSTDAQLPTPTPTPTPTPIANAINPSQNMAKTGAADLSPSSQPADANGVQTSQPKDECPHRDVIALFHEVLPSVRRVRDWTPARAQLLRTRWREDAKRQNLDWWRKFFTYVGQSDFLMGRTHSQVRKPFELGLEWLLKAENFAKVREGAYHEQDGDGK